MTGNISKVILITGCSSGIGKITARYLAQKGWTVYATARRVESITDLAQAGCHLLPLDVTDVESMRTAVTTIEKAHGAIGILINNAGYSQSGAIESVPIDKVRQQFETNVFGMIQLTQLVLPGMRQQHWGKIVNLSSMGGRLTFPGGGYYHATKYAVEALTDALRFEVAGFGIDAILIEPGLIRTNFGDTAATSVSTATPSHSPYSTFNEAVITATKATYETGPLARLGGPPEAVAKTIERAITASHPKTRYTVTPSARLLITMRRLLSDRQWDTFLKGQFPQPH